MRGTPTSGPYFSIEMVETRVIESEGCSMWIRLSASMSKVMATATLAPLGQGTGRRIMAARRAGWALSDVQPEVPGGEGRGVSGRGLTLSGISIQICGGTQAKSVDGFKGEKR